MPRPSTQETGAETPAGRDQDRIARRAYELYQARGGGDGRDFEDWLAAEREFSRTAGDPPGGERGE